MRCKNCGWENPQSNLKCEKCNAPLTGSMAGDSGRSVQSSPVEGMNLKGTVSESQIFGSQVARPAGAQNRSCPKCGYPVARDMKVCPNCGEYLGTDHNDPYYDMAEPHFRQQVSESRAGGAKPAIKCSKCGAQMEAASKFCPSCGAPARSGTVNPWMSPQNGTFCTLKPLSWGNEGIEYNPLSYSGEAITLNRANTDPNNQSITSKAQAKLTYENGAWFIEDQSVQQTTYIHAGRKTKLESGDIIILGNRRFEFKG